MTEETLPIGNSPKLRYILLAGLVEMGGVATAEDLRPMVVSDMNLKPEYVTANDAAFKSRISNTLIRMAGDHFVIRVFGSDVSETNVNLAQWFPSNRKDQHYQVVWEITALGREWFSKAKAGGDVFVYRGSIPARQRGFSIKTDKAEVQLPLFAHESTVNSEEKHGEVLSNDVFFGEEIMEGAEEVLQDTEGISVGDQTDGVVSDELHNQKHVPEYQPLYEEPNNGEDVKNVAVAEDVSLDDEINELREKKTDLKPSKTTSISSLGDDSIARPSRMSGKGVITQLENEGILSDVIQLLLQSEERHKKNGPFNPKNITDNREFIFAAIVLRRGQREFRQQLLEFYQRRCVISGSDAEASLEAAHIIPYLGSETNHLSNGLLLRADLHTLFDLKLLAIEPTSLTVLLSRALKKTTYIEFHGKHLSLPSVENGGPSREALALHFAETEIER